MSGTPNPRDIAPICEALQAPVVAARGSAPLQAKGGRARLLKTESGRVVTHGEVMGALLARAEIEVAVVDGKRPDRLPCRECGLPVQQNRQGPDALFCAKHKLKKTCTGGCGKLVRRWGSGFCRSCATRAAMGNVSPEERSRRASVGALKAKERWDGMSESERIAYAAEVSKRSFEMHRAKPFSERSKVAKKAKSTMTPEQRSEAVKKSHATRRARKAVEVAKP